MQKIFEGNRGEIYLIDYHGKKAVLKRQKRDKPNTLHNEAKILEYLQPSGIVPKLFEYGSDFIIMEYLEGISLKEAIKKEKKALKEALRLCYVLDRAGIWHKELGRYYHFIFTPKPKIIDFERSCFSSRPRNVLQFVGFYLRDFDTKEAVQLYKRDKRAGLQALEELLDV